jgi:hypothetical protein
MGRLLNEPPKIKWGMTEAAIVFFFVGSLMLVAVSQMTEMRDWLPGAIIGGLFAGGGLTGLIVSVVCDRKKQDD